MARDFDKAIKTAKRKSVVTITVSSKGKRISEYYIYKFSDLDEAIKYIRYDVSKKKFK